MLSEDNIINEDNEIIEYDLLEKIVNTGIKQCVCKIKQEINNNGKMTCKTGSGFFCDIPSKKMKVLITNNHLLNDDFLKKKKN